MEYFLLERFAIELDSVRITRRMTWKDIANATGIQESLLSRIQTLKGKPDLNNFAQLIVWSGLNPLDFFWTKPSKDTGTLDRITSMLFSDDNLSEKSKIIIDKLMKSSYEILRKTDIQI
jgi:hypothetical protein